MLPLFDMLANAQNGRGMELIARQFELNRQQMELAMEALLPAFSVGLKRNVSDPYGVGAFLNAMATGQHVRYFENAANAFSPQGVAEGKGILGHLFGSKELSRAIAFQAAQMTGICQEVLKQMMPVMAAMIMGGLSKQATGQLSGSSGNPIAEMTANMMRLGAAMAVGPMKAPDAPQPANPWDNPFGRALQQMFGAGVPREESPAPQSLFGYNPWAKIYEDMLGLSSKPAPQPRAKTNPSGRPRNPYDDLFGEMFETGRKQRDEYEKTVAEIFEEFTRAPSRRR